MKTTLLSTLALLALLTPITQAATWTQDLAAAQKQAADSHKNVLILFYASDWCGPCMAIKSELLDTKSFQDFAKENFELVELDYPQHKEQSTEIKAQNKALKQHYQVESLPTLVAITAEGKIIAKIVGHVESIRELRAKLSAGPAKP